MAEREATSHGLALGLVGRAARSGRRASNSLTPCSQSISNRFAAVHRRSQIVLQEPDSSLSTGLGCTAVSHGSRCFCVRNVSLRHGSSPAWRRRSASSSGDNWRVSTGRGVRLRGACRHRSRLWRPPTGSTPSFPAACLVEECSNFVTGVVVGIGVVPQPPHARQTCWPFTPRPLHFEQPFFGVFGIVL